MGNSKKRKKKKKVGYNSLGMIAIALVVLVLLGGLMLESNDLKERLTGYDAKAATLQQQIEDEQTRTEEIDKLKKYNVDKEHITEKILQKLILEDIEKFLLELGTGFSFIKSEYKIKIGNTYNYIDLLLFNIKYNCYVVIELKVTELKKEHIGQIQIYMNYIDKHIKTINQDKTIGIIITKRDNRYYIEYSSDKRILTREYILN